MASAEDGYRAYAVQVAKKYGLNPLIFLAQINAESGFRNLGSNSAGAAGIAQFVPGTASKYHVNVHDPYSSLDGAGRLMRDNLKANRGSYPLALAAYNAGQGAVNSAGGKIPNIAETQAYVKKIMGDNSESTGKAGKTNLAGIIANDPKDIARAASGASGVAGAAVDAAGGASGIASGALSGINAVGAGVLAIGHFFEQLFNPTFWLRVGKIALGGAIILVCLVRLTGMSMPPIIPI